MGKSSYRTRKQSALGIGDVAFRSFGKTIVRSAIIFLVLLLWPLSLPSVASAHPMSLYGPWDQPHDVQGGGPARSVTSQDVLAGCGRGRYRDPATRQCNGPADRR